jgi:hypothetical protein
MFTESLGHLVVSRAGAPAHTPAALRGAEFGKAMGYLEPGSARSDTALVWLVRDDKWRIIYSEMVNPDISDAVVAGKCAEIAAALCPLQVRCLRVPRTELRGIFDKYWAY